MNPLLPTEKGLNLYEKCDYASKVTQLLPKNEEIFFDQPFQAISKDRLLKIGLAKIKDKNGNSLGWIDVSDATIKAEKKAIETVTGEAVQSCSVPTNAGEIIGWPGNDGVSSTNSMHLEIFMKKDAIFGSVGFFANGKKGGKEGNLLKFKQGTSFSLKKEPVFVDCAVPQNTVVDLKGAVNKAGKYPAEQHREVSTIEIFEVWVKRNDLSYVGEVDGVHTYSLASTLKYAWTSEPGILKLGETERDVYVGIPPTYNNQATQLTLLEQKDLVPNNKDARIRKIKYQVPGYQAFSGWLKVDGLEKHLYNSKSKCRYRVQKDLKGYWQTSPEVIEFTSSSFKLEQDLLILKKDCKTVQTKDGTSWLGIPKKAAEDKELWFDSDNYNQIEEYIWLKETDSGIEKLNPFDWESFFTKCEEKDVANAEDGFCDAVPIYNLVDLNGDGAFEVGEFKKAIGNPKTKNKLRQLVVEHPSEWFFPSNDGGKDNKWGTRLKGPRIDPSKAKVKKYMDDWEAAQYKPPRYGFNYSDKKYKAFLEVAEKCSFLQDVGGFEENEKLWYFHPIAFVQHLKRLFGSYQLKDGLIIHQRIKQKRITHIEVKDFDIPKVKNVVMHQTYTKTASAVFTSWSPSSNSKKVGTQFVIDKDGTIYQTARYDKKTQHVRYRSGFKLREITQKIEEEGKKRKYTWKSTSKGSGVYNSNSIGIEFVGWYTGDEFGYEDITSEQLDAAQFLVPIIKEIFDIGNENIYRHPEVDKKNSSEAFSVPKTF